MRNFKTLKSELVYIKAELSSFISKLNLNPKNDSILLELQREKNSHLPLTLAPGLKLDSTCLFYNR